jgi:predicted RND superfamily exporter protein
VPPSRGLIAAFKGTSHLTTLLVFVQATLAGLFISGEQIDAKDVHEMVGNLLFLVVIVQLVLGFTVRDWSRFGLWLFVLLLAILVAVQTGLGYVGRDESLAEAIHIPLGVFIFGFALIISLLASIEDRLPERGAG